MLNNCAVPCDAGADGANHGEIAMKVLDIVPRHGSGLYSAILKEQAEIRKSGRGTFVCPRQGKDTRRRAVDACPL